MNVESLLGLVEDYIFTDKKESTPYLADIFEEKGKEDRANELRERKNYYVRGEFWFHPRKERDIYDYPEFSFSFTAFSKTKAEICSYVLNRFQDEIKMELYEKLEDFIDLEILEMEDQSSFIEYDPYTVRNASVFNYTLVPCKKPDDNQIHLEW